VANLAQTLHRSIEARDALRQLKLAFASRGHFRVHAALPAGLQDEGAANFLRMASDHGDRGIEIFVYGEEQRGGFPARQRRIASEAIARRHMLDPERVYFVQQSNTAIQAGAFHNDVVSVANERVLFTHEQAFEDKVPLYDFIYRTVPDAVIIEVPAERVSLNDAVGSYLFNSQLVTVPGGDMVLIVPGETRENRAAWDWLQEMLAGNGPIRRVEVVEVRESMRNGGGPACLRLRVPVDADAHSAIDQRFLLDDAAADAIRGVVERYWPREIAPDDLCHPDLWAQCVTARHALAQALGFIEGEL
jgi:succinylarginine dihydrolase